MSALSRVLVLSGVVPCALSLLVTVSGPACAIDTTPAGASSLEAAVRDALGSLMGPSIKIGDRPVLITAAGDHYDVVVPMLRAGQKTSSGAPLPQDIRMTGTARPGENGTWIIEDVKLTNPLVFTIDMPVPAGEDAAATVPGGVKRPPVDKPATKVVPVTYTMDQQGQVGRIVWDPSFKTPSTWTTAVQSTSIKNVGGPVSTTTLTGPLNAMSTLRPAGVDRVDAVSEGTIQDYRINSVGGPLGLDMAMKTLRISSALNGVSRAQGVALMQAMTTAITAALTVPGKAGELPQVAPEMIKAILAALQDFASDFNLDETVDGFVAKASGQTVTLDQLRLGLDAKSDAGLLRAGMTMGMSGLALPDLDLGGMAALLPRQMAFRPVIGGVAVADVMRFATLASDNKDPAPEDIAALFSHGGITGGVESLTIELAGATITGQGQVVATGPSPDAITGTATLTAQNFDAAMQKVTAIPALAQQAVPVMVFIKGIGRTVGDKLVWDVTYKDNKLLINNVDLTAMAGGGTGPAPRPAARPTAPAVPAPVLPTPGVGGTPKSSQRQGQVPSWAR